MELLTAISLFVLIPSVLGIFSTFHQKERDHVSLYVLLTLLLVSLYFTLFPYVHVFQRWFNWHQFFNQFMSIVGLGLAIFITRRHEKPFLCGLMVCATSLIVLSTFDIIEEIWK